MRERLAQSTKPAVASAEPAIAAGRAPRLSRMRPPIWLAPAKPRKKMRM